MSDTKRIVRADLDEIVEAVEKQVGGWEAEDRDQRALIDNIRTALERFVVEEQRSHNILTQMKAHLNVLEAMHKGLESASPETKSYSEGSLVQIRFWIDRIGKSTTPKKGGNNE